MEDGYRESEESWAYVLRELDRRGMKPVWSINSNALP